MKAVRKTSSEDLPQGISWEELEAAIKKWEDRGVMKIQRFYGFSVDEEALAEYRMPK